jgi:site-specific DNA-methyltransferase (adenine-specific)
MSIQIIHGDNLDIMSTFQDGFARLIYIDPPFNTGKVQARADKSYKDSFDNFKDFIVPRIQEAHRLLTDDGSFFIHLDWRECHYVKVWTDEIFGRENFMNEIIWSFDYGGRSKKKWSAKHNNIFWYAKDSKNYTFNYDEADRIPYMAPGLVGKDKASKGKVVTDSWWNTIVHTNGKEKTGYPTQKPLKILERIVKVHSMPGDMVMDFFAGSGSFGEAANKHSRDCILIDENPIAIEVMRRRFEHIDNVIYGLVEGSI